MNELINVLPLFLLDFLFIIDMFYRIYKDYLNERRFKEMAIVYATLIINGKKEFKDVPEKIKEQVRQVLVDLDLADLAQE